MNQIKTWQQRQAETGIGSVEAKDDEIRELRQAIEQAGKVEPVGYIDSIGNFQNTRLDDRDTPVYTNPPTAPAQPSPLDVALVDRLVEQAQQPLPDKQIEELAEWYGLEHMDYKPFARAIEQAHGIKGEKK